MTTSSEHPERLLPLVLDWYARHRRDLPWRVPGTSAWAVLVSEVMLQQTPVVRVEPAWREWMQRWPDPAALAAATPAEVLRAWDRLGYPRRALRLRDAAIAIRDRHGGTVPRTTAELRALPGVGSYTAAAIRSFAYGERDVVLDTNVRRVLARALDGAALPAPSLTRAEERRAEAVVPADPATSARWNIGLMELGALVCTARAPRCGSCPLAHTCAWRRAGAPGDVHAARRRTQPWQGTDRQARGRLMAALRDAVEPLAVTELPDWGDETQRDRALAGLVADGLVEVTPQARYRLPEG
ncbi:A/G-specific adenine glycosylase [Pseudactinotalea suaedae]|uniref:A/G-specific adenine glycosylase n=1 Tax=Pseudactinotalea suaedae TaxID=1524924 RepID=UPI001F4F3D7E|nr:A/G-specific adenine glycosylase [Pseudactinotalea suaedae]